MAAGLEAAGLAAVAFTGGGVGFTERITMLLDLPLEKKKLHIQLRKVGGLIPGAFFFSSSSLLSSLLSEESLSLALLGAGATGAF